MRIARVGWYLSAAIVWGILILSVAMELSAIVAGAPGNMTAQAPSWLIGATNIANLAAQTAASLTSLVLACVLFLKRGREGMALLLSYFLLVNGIVIVPLSFLEPYWPGAQAITYSVIQPLVYGPLLVAFL